MTKYQKYQLNWMLKHNYSIEDLITELTHLQYEDPEDKERISTPISELFNEWVSYFGFNLEIWACKEEWEENESLLDEE